MDIELLVVSCNSLTLATDPEKLYIVDIKNEKYLITIYSYCRQSIWFEKLTRCLKFYNFKNIQKLPYNRKLMKHKIFEDEFLLQIDHRVIIHKTKLSIFA